MTKTELLEIIRNGESSGIEFKRDTLENFALAKELVAFANLRGGRVLLGVEKDGTIFGITRQNLEEWVMTTCRDKIRPEIIPYFEVVRDVEPGKDVVVVEVERGWSVHHVWPNNHRAYYIRVGTQSREASQEELQRLFQQRGSVRAELSPVSGSSLADLDLRRLLDYFRRVRRQDAPDVDDEAGWTALLANTELLSDEGSTAPCTVAGLLLFGKNPRRFLPQSGIDAVAYPGVVKDYGSLKRAPLSGPMVALFRRSRSGAKVVEPGLVEQAEQFIRLNAGVTATLEDRVRRVERPAYPEEPVREVLVNALVHRDYLLSATDIELSLYADRLEAISPGSLPNGVTPERMRLGVRAARNQLLKDVMRDYGYLEHMGMGVPLKIIKGMHDFNETDPDLVEEGERFVVRLWKEPKA